MNYKDALLFIGKCLTINNEIHNKIIVEKQLIIGNIDWETIVKVSTSHYVFPALYCNLKKAKFLNYLPKDLVEYMKHIADLNRERNQQIIEQAKEINTLLLDNNITPIFLKGTGNLIEGLYEDIAERMVGDIDFIVSKNDYLKTADILIKDNYNKINDDFSSYHWHFPRLIKKNRIGAIEIHNKILKRPYSDILSFDQLNKDHLSVNEIKIASCQNQLLNNILPKQINDNLYHSKTISLRTIYDIYLIFNKSDKILPETNNKKVNLRFNNFLSCAAYILNYNLGFRHKETNNSKKYLNSFIRKLENSKKEKRKIYFLDNYIRIKNKINILQYSFIDKEYRSHTFKSIRSLQFYLNTFSIKF